MKGFQERKRRHGLIQVSWSFLTSWHLSPPTLAYCYPMIAISDGTWAKLQIYFQSLSVQPCGDGGKNCSPQAHGILFLISLLHGPTPPLVHLDLSYFPLSYTFFPEGQQEIFASWKGHLRKVLPSS